MTLHAAVMCRIEKAVNLEALGKKKAETEYARFSTDEDWGRGGAGDETVTCENSFGIFLPLRECGKGAGTSTVP